MEKVPQMTQIHPIYTSVNHLLIIYSCFCSTQSKAETIRYL